MKKFYLLIPLVILWGSCSSRPSSSNQQNGIENFDWLVGKWERIQEKTDRTTFESWTKADSTHFVGHGYILKGVDTVWQEKMLLSKTDSTWSLSVKTPGNEDEVTFKVVRFESNSFVSENPVHDFPQQISYSFDGVKLHAMVSGNSMELTFDFKSIE